jgi:hypothetical protein
VLKYLDMLLSSCVLPKIPCNVLTAITFRKFLLNILYISKPLPDISIIISDLLAVYDDWSVLSLWMLVHDLSHAPSELQERVGEGVGVTRPLCVVELDHFPLLSVLSQPAQILSNGSYSYEED